jgi:hypothetical protein
VIVLIIKHTDMKKQFSMLFAFAMCIGLCIVASCNNATSGDEKQSTSEPAKSSAATIDGAWEIVWAEANDTLLNPLSPHQFKMFNNGVFSMIAKDSAGNISYAGYGKYELDGNIYKETFMYSDEPKYIGASDWQEYEVKGDTLYTKGFNKVIIGGKDVTADFPKIEEKRVRVKW